MLGLFVDVVVSQHPAASVTAVHSYISHYLKMAPWREGGAGKGCHLPDSSCVEKPHQTDELDRDETRGSCDGDDTGDSDVESDTSTPY